MSREERNIKLKHLITCMKCEVSGKVCDDNCSTQYEAGNMGEIIENLEAISKILEQEPCENTISRQAVLDLIVANHTELNGVNVVMYSPLCKDIKQLPSATPQPKVGHWIEDGYCNLPCVCSYCGHEGRYDMKFCPNCGAKMTESEG